MIATINQIDSKVTETEVDYHFKLNKKHAFSLMKETNKALHHSGCYTFNLGGAKTKDDFVKLIVENINSGKNM